VTEARTERPFGGAPDNDNAAGTGWLAGGGEMGSLIRARDWTETPLGPPQRWPQSLRSAVSILLPSRAQICLFWGPELVAIYNDAYRPVLGIKHPRSLGRPVREVWSEFWEDVLRPLFEGVRGTGEAFWASDHPFALERHGYPEETYFDVSYDPVRDESGGVGGVFCIVSETTGRVVGERRLRTLSALGRVAMQARTLESVYALAGEVLRAAADDIPFALLYEWDAGSQGARLRETAGLPAGHPLAPPDPGPDYLSMGTGLPAEGAVIDAAALGFPALPGGRWPEPCSRIVVLPIAAAASEHPEGFLVAGTSPRRPFDAGYRDYLGLVASAIGNALSNARALEAERRRAQALAELDRAKTTFFSNISHEFRTPLTLLLGPLREELAGEALPPAGRARLEMAYRNGMRLLKLVNALLDFSRIEAGRMSARFEPTDLAGLTTELASNFESACADAGLGLAVRCEPLSQPAYVDREMWEKIVLNLLSNAFKFTFEGSIEVCLRESDARALLTVRDTGVGIPAASMPRLFERFHRVEGARARTHEGSGIGLAMVHELVRLHGGEIRAESEPGRGAAFHVALPLGHDHLPREQVAEAAAAAPGAGVASMFRQEVHDWLRLPDASRLPEVAPAPGAERARILVVDDNADMREYIERLLGAHWEVNAVEDGEMAMRALATSRYHLVLTDAMMPRMDGFALLRAIRSDASLRQLPVLMLSARAGEESRIEGLEAGADDYLVKPFSARELVAQVRAQLAMAQARRLAAREREVLLADEREARMDLQRHWEDLVELFDKAPNPMVILRGREHVVELANAAACEVWGRTAAQVLRRPLFEALPEIAGQGLERLLEEVLASGQVRPGRERPVTLDRGRGPETVYFDFVYAPLRSRSGRIERIAVTAFDVTERVRLRQRSEEAVPR
jgi:signal transduction histidine kinase/CheY-like chemotaxis protein